MRFLVFDFGVYSPRGLLTLPSVACCCPYTTSVATITSALLISLPPPPPPPPAGAGNVVLFCNSRDTFSMSAALPHSHRRTLISFRKLRSALCRINGNCSSW
eukprot:1264201-Rhodomonas_salina.3